MSLRDKFPMIAIILMILIKNGWNGEDENVFWPNKDRNSSKTVQNKGQWCSLG